MSAYIGMLKLIEHWLLAVDQVNWWEHAAPQQAVNHKRLEASMRSRLTDCSFINIYSRKTMVNRAILSK